MFEPKYDSRNKYQYIGFLPNSVRIKERGLWGMNDLDGNEILTSQFMEVFTLSAGNRLIAAREGSFWQIFNLKGDPINNEKYDSLYPFYGMFGMTKIQKNGKYGLLNKMGKIIIPTAYKKIEKFGKGIVLHNFDLSTEFITRKELLQLPEIRHDLKNEQIKSPIKNILKTKITNKHKFY